MRMASPIDGVGCNTRARHRAKGVGAAHEPDAAYGMFDGEPPSPVRFGGPARVKNGAAHGGDLDGIDRHRPSDKVLVGSKKPDFRTMSWGAATVSADETSPFPPCEDRAAEIQSPVLSRIHDGAAMAMVSGGRQSRVETHGKPSPSGSAKCSSSACDVEPPRSDRRSGIETKDGPERIAGHAGGVNAASTIDRLVDSWPGRASAIDGNLTTEFGPTSGTSPAFLEGHLTSVEERSTNGGLQEIEHRSPPVEFLRPERRGALSTDRLSVVVHCEENGDVGVQITIRGEDAHIGIIASSSVARSIERDQSLLESSIQSSTGLNTVVSVRSGEEVETRGSLQSEGGGGWASHGSNFTGEETTGRDRAPGRPRSGNERNRLLDTPSQAAFVAGASRVL